LIVGEGGVAVEAMPDNRLLLVPFDRADFDAALAKLRIGPLFQGVRGERPLDADAVYAAARAVGDLLADGAALSVEINPLIVTPDGAVAVDALVEVPSAAPLQASCHRPDNDTERR
jgi:succinyl-CoA synthetase beta subunit